MPERLRRHAPQGITLRLGVCPYFCPGDYTQTGPGLRIRFPGPSLIRRVAAVSKSSQFCPSRVLLQFPGVFSCHSRLFRFRWNWLHVRSLTVSSATDLVRVGTERECSAGGRMHTDSEKNPVRSVARDCPPARQTTNFGGGHELTKSSP